MSRLDAFGVIGRRGRFPVLEPLFERAPQINLARGSIRVREGEMVLATERPGGAKVTERLGAPGNARDVVGALLLDRGLERGFATRLEAEAGDAAEAAQQVASERRDLRALDTFTVDPASARDFDDAVSAQPEGDGVRLWIHIADVAAHVRPGSALDAEALRRANSTYVPGAVEPMLPVALSAGACSLAPDVDRLAVTTEIALDAGGQTRRARASTAAASAPTTASPTSSSTSSSPAAPGPAGRDRGAAGARPPGGGRAAGAAPGSALEISTAEPEFGFDDEGHVVGAHAVEQTEAHGLIEQLMILTNERVAELCERRGTATLYRVHERSRPGPDRGPVRTARRARPADAAVGRPEKHLPGAGSRAGGAGESAGRVARPSAADTATPRIHRLCSARSNPPSTVDRNLGHAGLASPAYCHFTSPIRRYPDLVAHRALLALIGAGEQEPERASRRETPVSGARSASASRSGSSATPTTSARPSCSSGSCSRRGWSRQFEGEVSGVIGAGAFVRFGGELGDVYEGFLPARRMRGERFDLDSTETALVGRRSGRRVRLGDPVDRSRRRRRGASGPRRPGPGGGRG